MKSLQQKGSLLILTLMVPAMLMAQELKNYRDPVVTKINHQLLQVIDHFEETQKRGKVAKAFPGNDQLIVHQGKLVVEAVATGSPDKLREKFQQLGMDNIEVAGPIISGYLPVARIREIAADEELNFIRPVFKPVTNIGSVTSQGDAAQRSDIAKSEQGVDGTGVKIGILSDSYDRNNAEATGVQSGDLPGAGNPNGFTTPVEVLAEGPEGSIDEGRGMAEIIHDVAPGSSLAFRSGFFGLADFANGIRELKGAGCEVIVDDIFYATDPWFQDGLVSQAIDEVVQEGASYFVSAANYDRKSYESEFRPAGVFHIQGYGDYVLHDFDPGPGVDVFQNITKGPDGFSLINSFILALQWDDPFASNCVGCPGADTDVDLFTAPIAFAGPSGILVNGASANNSIDQDAVEFIQEGLTVNASVYVVIGKKVGAPGPNPDPGRIKYINLTGNIVEYATNSPTSVGHQVAAGGVGVGAASYTTVPTTKGEPPIVEGFSSAGGGSILFDIQGNRITPIQRNKPEVVGPDDVNTTFFVEGRDIEGDGFPNFNGTSASAPHVAGVAALMIEASNFTVTPGEIAQALINTAIDMDDPFTNGFDTGFDFKTGYGFIQADDAVDEVVVTSSNLASSGSNRFTVAGNPMTTPKLQLYRNSSAQEDETYHMAVYDQRGRMMQQDQVAWKAGNASFELPLKLSTTIQPGELFYLRIRSEKGSQQTLKIIKQ